MSQPLHPSIEAAPTLKPCPFCGNPAVMDEPVADHFTVTCAAHGDDCDVYAISGPYKDRAKAAEAWNRRVS